MNKIHSILTYSCVAIIALCIVNCSSESSTWKEKPLNAEVLHASVKNLTDVIVHDIFSPPVASRIYAYPCIAAYEVLCQNDPSKKSLTGQLHGFGQVTQPKYPEQTSYELAAIVAFHEVGKELIFSELRIVEHLQQILDQLENEWPKKVVENSREFGQEMAQVVIDWADHDMYKESRSYPKFSVLDKPGRWQPTPPDYMAGIEPHWREMRTFVIDSANQFRPEPPPPFDMAKSSDFYKELQIVYDAVKEATDEHIEIAKFWDCNPYVSTHKGHFMFATKKITPGGHWMGIAATASRMKKESMADAASTYALTSIALYDAFISCWDEKYLSNLIRPETVINQHLDESWQPILQTPPFPEHTSGHSVISSAAAHALTDRFGDAFGFIDSVEVEYGLPVRSFTSFKNASDEAAISRLYGGIHYMPAITEGVKQGTQVGEHILEHIDFNTD